MKTTFFLLKHPIEGELKLEADDQQVYFSCRWPFDLATDDWDQWTVTSNTFSLKQYRSKVQSLAKGKAIRIPGIQSGFLSLKVLDSSHIELVAIESRSKSKDEFQISIAASRNDLLPRPMAEIAEPKA